MVGGMTYQNPPPHTADYTAAERPSARRRRRGNRNRSEPELSRGHQIDDHLPSLPPYPGRFLAVHTVLVVAGALLLLDALDRVAGLTLRWVWFPYTPICMGLILVLNIYNLRTWNAQTAPHQPAPLRYKLLSVLAVVAVFATVITPAH